MSPDLPFLVDVKLLAEHGRSHASNGYVSSLDRRLAIHHVHNAIELLIRRKGKELGIEAPDFDKLISKMKERKIVIPRERDLRELNHARIQSQHYESTLDEKDAYRLTINAIELLKELFSEFYHLAYEKVSLTELVRNVSVKSLLDKAESSLANHKYRSCAYEARAAIEKTKWIIRQNMHRLHVVDDPIHLRLSLKSEDERRLVGKFEEIIDLALFLRYAQELSKLNSMTSEVSINKMNEENPTISVSKSLFGPRKPLTHEEAEFAYRVAVDFVLWADSTFGLKPL